MNNKIPSRRHILTAPTATEFVTRTNSYRTIFLTFMNTNVKADSLLNREMTQDIQADFEVSWRRWPIIILYGISSMILNFNVSDN